MNKQALLSVVNMLIDEPDPKYYVEAMDAVAALSKRYPVGLTGDLDALNPLVKLMVEDPEAAQRVRLLIDSHRAAKDLPLCWPVDAPKFDKGAYQRELMQRRRLRVGRVVEIENLQRPESERVRGNARLEMEQRQLSEWGAAITKSIERAKEAAGGKLSRELQEGIRERFYKNIDAELDAREEAVRLELMKPQHLRRKI